MTDTNSREQTRRSRRVRQWLIVGGVGCGTLVVIVVGLIVGSVLLFRDAVQEFERADGTLASVVERFGPISEFRPDPTGTIPPDRVEAFLTAREGIATERAEVEQSLVLLSGDDVGGLRKTMAGLRLMHQSADFLARRNEKLLDVGIGLGEYDYIYTLAYYSWLGKSPADGPSFQLVGDEGYVLETAFEGTPEHELRAHRTEITRSSLNRLFLPVLRNQLSDLDAAMGDGVETWRQTLAAEIAALEGDAHRLPWEEGLPESIAASLQPYRDRLEESYGPMSNALEIGVARR